MIGFFLGFCIGFLLARFLFEHFETDKNDKK